MRCSKREIINVCTELHLCSGSISSISSFQMDESVMYRCIRAIWHFSKFAMREVTSQKMTNAKALLCGVIGVKLIPYLREASYLKNLDPFIIPFVHTAINVSYTLCRVTVLLETAGMIPRVLAYFNVVFFCNCLTGYCGVYGLPPRSPSHVYRGFNSHPYCN